MRYAFPVVSAALASALTVSACGGGDSGGTCMSPKIVASEMTNYSFTSTLSFPPVKVKPNT